MADMNHQQGASKTSGELTLAQRMRAHVVNRSGLSKDEDGNPVVPNGAWAMMLEAADELESLEFTFDLQWEADMRATKRWQEAHPGNDLVWPDRANMVVWLMENYAALLAERGAFEKVLTKWEHELAALESMDADGRLTRDWGACSLICAREIVRDLRAARAPLHTATVSSGKRGDAA